MTDRARNGSERRAYRVRGRVQGVGFRWWTRNTASDLGLRGSVRNLADGSVAVEAAGNAAALDQLEAKLEHGPATAKVESVRHEEPGSNALPTGFEIVR